MITKHNILVEEIAQMLKNLDSTGDVVIEVENNTKKPLLLVYFQDTNGEYYLKIFKKEVDNFQIPYGARCIEGTKVSFMINLDEEEQPDDSM